MAQSPPIVFIATHGAKEINENNKELKTFDTGKQEHLYIYTALPGEECQMKTPYVYNAIVKTIFNGTHDIRYDDRTRNTLVKILQEELYPKTGQEKKFMKGSYYEKNSSTTIVPTLIKPNNTFHEKYFIVNFNDISDTEKTMLDGINVVESNGDYVNKMFPAEWDWTGLYNHDVDYHLSHSNIPFKQWNTIKEENFISLSQLVERLEDEYPGQNCILLDFSCDVIDGANVTDRFIRHEQLSRKRDATTRGEMNPNFCQNSPRRCAVMGRTTRKKRKKRKKRKQTKYKRNIRGYKKKKRSKNKKRRNKTN